MEIALGLKARRDPKFMSIYQNRHKNPAAWNAALGAVAGEIKSKVQFRQDSQLTENVIAAKEAGVNNYIVKPFNAATLKTKLASVIGNF